ncbi:MAG TPA: 16S rRNA (cytosine(967)-C(5))-methyltransferase RsmB, partial [Clostridiales bacterium]|nr:16S rRNA (cytosine(967)-C(5))-methyltransferase RsmB [Clostridiales bacterium]
MKGRGSIGPGTGTKARDLAFQILECVQREKIFSHAALRESLAEQPEMRPVDRRLVSILVYGVLRWRRTLDHVIGLHSKIPVDRMESATLQILRTGAFQLLFMDRVPPSAACNESVNVARKHRMFRSAGFINAVLRAVERDKRRMIFESPSPDDPDMVEKLGLYHSFPDWLVHKWIWEFGPEKTVSLLEASNR